jgi:signal transduction histidine kinase
MASLGPKSRPRIAQPLALAALLILAILVGGNLVARSLRHWRGDIIKANMSLSSLVAHQLAVHAEDYLGRLPADTDDQGRFLITTPRDTLDLQLTLLATRDFTTAPGLKGGFWVLQENEFMGYADPWSPPPAPVFGPPPRSYQLILTQIKETIATGEPVVRLHEVESVSVSKSVFPLATEPIRRDGRLIAVAWVRIHIERDLPASRLTRYLNVTAFVAVFAFLVVLLTSLYQRREIRSLNRSLQRIEQNPDHRLAPRRGMFGSIHEAINALMDALDAVNRQHRQLEVELHQQDKMAALGNLLAAVAHEVKTPLAILKTRVQIWQRDLKQFSDATGQPPPLTEDSMQIVLNEIDRLSELLRRLLYFSRPVRQDLMRPVEAQDLVRHTALFIKPRLLEHRIDLDMDLEAGGAEILGEPDALHQVFLNILTNSIQMVGEGGLISITARPSADGSRVVVQVEDSGPGLPPAIREQVFTPFYSQRRGGSGLGLAIAYEIVHAHRGTIEFVDPERLGGAHCRVTFPLLQPTAEAP